MCQWSELGAFESRVSGRSSGLPLTRLESGGCLIWLVLVTSQVTSGRIQLRSLAVFICEMGARVKPAKQNQCEEARHVMPTERGARPGSAHGLVAVLLGCRLHSSP